MSALAHSIGPHRYIGLMSGTSIDGVDVALVEFDGSQCHLLGSYLHPIEKSVKAGLSSLCSPLDRTPPDALPTEQSSPEQSGAKHRIELLGELDNKMGHVFADAVIQFMKLNNIPKDSIRAIGNHGQTIRHRPGGGLAGGSPFTLQIGDPNLIACRTGIQTISDFRRMDMAAGGQAAPLAPAFHEAMMRSKTESRIILNLGGIANMTLLSRDLSIPVSGFDIGPANTLLDAYYRKNHPDCSRGFDLDSEFAQKGKCIEPLLDLLLADPYFKLPPPKSTGREYFSLDWLQKHLDKSGCQNDQESVQATLLELTIQTIANTINKKEFGEYQVYACGGGMHNRVLLERLELKSGKKIFQTNELGVNGDYLEAMTFAWLAHQRLEQKPGNLPSVTGAREPKVLGAIYHP